MGKKVSIGVPVYNVEKYLKRCLDSLCNQTYKDIEIVIIDDGSTDSSPKICDEYAEKDKRIRVIHQSNAGLSQARNVGIDNSVGDYLMFVDSDDYVANNFVEEMVKAIEEHNVDMVRCKAIEYAGDNSYTIEDLRGHEGITYRNNEFRNLVKDVVAYGDKYIPSYTWALIVKRDKLNVRHNPEVKGRTDLAFFVRLMVTSDVSSMYFLDEALYHYCYNDTSITKGSKGTDKYLNAIVVSTEEIKKYLRLGNMLDEKLESEICNTDIIMMIRRLYTLTDASVFEISKIIKENFKKKEFKNILKKAKISGVKKRWKLLLAFLKMHLYLLVAIYIKDITKE